MFETLRYGQKNAGKYIYQVYDFWIFRRVLWNSSYFFHGRGVPRAPSSSSLVACIAAVAGCGGRGDNFHHFFNPAQIDGVVPGKCGFERPKMRMKPTALEQSWGYTTQMLHV